MYAHSHIHINSFPRIFIFFSTRTQQLVTLIILLRVMNNIRMCLFIPHCMYLSMQLWRFWLKLLAVRTGQAQIFSEDKFLCIWHFNAKHTTCLTRDTKHTTCLISSSQELTTACTGDCTDSYIAFHEPQQLDDDGHREHMWQCIQNWNAAAHWLMQPVPPSTH